MRTTGEVILAPERFHFDKEGRLITADNQLVMGFQADENGKITSKMGPVSAGRAVVDAKPTKDVNLFMNLDLRADKALEFDPTRPDNTNHFNTAVTVYDSAGNAGVCFGLFQ